MVLIDMFIHEVNWLSKLCVYIKIVKNNFNLVKCVILYNICLSTYHV